MRPIVLLIPFAGRHIKKENILLAAANKDLDLESQSQIAARFEKLETEAIGPGKHGEYHRLLESLKAIYLSAAAAD